MSVRPSLCPRRIRRTAGSLRGWGRSRWTRIASGPRFCMATRFGPISVPKLSSRWQAAQVFGNAPCPWRRRPSVRARGGRPGALRGGAGLERGGQLFRLLAHGASSALTRSRFSRPGSRSARRIFPPRPRRGTPRRAPAGRRATSAAAVRSRGLRPRHAATSTAATPGSESRSSVATAASCTSCGWSPFEQAASDVALRLERAPGPASGSRRPRASACVRAVQRLRPLRLRPVPCRAAAACRQRRVDAPAAPGRLAQRNPVSAATELAGWRLLGQSTRAHPPGRPPPARRAAACAARSGTSERASSVAIHASSAKQRGKHAAGALADELSTAKPHPASAGSRRSSFASSRARAAPVRHRAEREREPGTARARRRRLRAGRTALDRGAAAAAQHGSASRTACSRTRGSSSRSGRRSGRDRRPSPGRRARTARAPAPPAASTSDQLDEAPAAASGSCRW